MDTMDDSRSNFSSTNSTFSIPTILTSDYIQIVYLVLTFCFGAPLNLYTFFKLSRQYYVTKSRILLLSLHLNISDLMILFFFAFPKICWLYTYQWMGGGFLCKTVKFLQALSFTLSSNVIVCIGLDRLFSLWEPLRIRATAGGKCKKMLLVSWVLALICSAPQLHVWTTFDPAPDWVQCVDVWSIWDYQNTTSYQAQTVRTAYKVFHILVVFWLPFAVVLVCYIIILKIVYKNLGDDQLVQVIRTRSANSFNNNNNNNNSSRRSLTKTSRDNPVIGQLGRCPSSGFHRQQQPQQTILRRNVNQMRVRRSKYHTLKITMLIVLAYAVFWLPYNVMAVWNIADFQSYEEYVDKYLYFFYNLIAVNAVVNPLIYSRLSFLLCGRKNTSRSKANVRFIMGN